MAGIAYRYSGSVRSLTGAAYTNPTAGTYRLNVRTGSGSNDIMKFGLTTNTSASAYSPKMLINGNVCYIGRTEGGTASSTRSSSYVSEYRTASRASTSATSYLQKMVSWKLTQTNTKSPININMNWAMYDEDDDEYYDIPYQINISGVSSMLTITTSKSIYSMGSITASFKGSYNNNTRTTVVYDYFNITGRSGFYNTSNNKIGIATTQYPIHRGRYISNYYIWANNPGLADIGRAIECDTDKGQYYFKSATYSILHDYDIKPYISTTNYTRSSMYTSATITATRSSTYTYANNTHNYNI